MPNSPAFDPGWLRGQSKLCRQLADRVACSAATARELRTIAEEYESDAAHLEQELAAKKSAAPAAALL